MSDWNALRSSDLNTLFSRGEHDRLIELLQAPMRKTIRRFRGLSHEQREDALSVATVHLLSDFRTGKSYGGAPIRSVACARASFVVKDMFKILDKPRNYGITLVSLDYAFPDSPEADRAQTIDVADPSVDVVDECLQSEVAAVALRGLSSREREIAIKRCLEAKSAEQIGSELRCTANAVDQAFFRAKKKMKTNLESYLGDDDFGVPAI
jgi:RNA polymerase sigma factor (sigma-70 family)